MEKVFAIGFRLTNVSKPLFYGYNNIKGEFLTPYINLAYKFMTLEKAKRDANNLSKLFFGNQVEYTIYEGTRKI